MKNKLEEYLKILPFQRILKILLAGILLWAVLFVQVTAVPNATGPTGSNWYTFGYPASLYHVGKTLDVNSSISPTASCFYWMKPIEKGAEDGYRLGTKGIFLWEHPWESLKQIEHFPERFRSSLSWDVGCPSVFRLTFHGMMSCQLFEPTWRLKGYFKERVITDIVYVSIFLISLIYFLRSKTFYQNPKRWWGLLAISLLVIAFYLKTILHPPTVFGTPWLIDMLVSLNGSAQGMILLTFWEWLWYGGIFFCHVLKRYRRKIPINS